MRLTLLFAFLLCVNLVVGSGSSWADEPMKPVEVTGKLEKEAQSLLKLQLEIQTDTLNVRNQIEKSDDKKPPIRDVLAIEKIAKLQSANVTATKKMLKALDNEKTAVAFTQVMEEILKDMQAVEKNLEKNDLGAATTQIQKDLVESLKDVVRALRSPK